MNVINQLVINKKNNSTKKQYFKNGFNRDYIYIYIYNMVILEYWNIGIMFNKRIRVIDALIIYI